MEVIQIVVGFVVRPEGRFLVQPRAGDPALEGLWELPGGRIGHGETHASALTREVREEVGIAVEVGELVCALCHAYGERRVAIHAYRCTPVADIAAAPAGARWLTADEYRALPQPRANPPLVDAFARHPCGT